MIFYLYCYFLALINLYLNLNYFNFFFSGHGTTGEYIAQANKVSYNTEKVPKRICLYVEKGRDQRPVPVDFPEIIDISCGTNHSVGTFLTNLVICE